MSRDGVLIALIPIKVTCLLYSPSIYHEIFVHDVDSELVHSLIHIDSIVLDSLEQYGTSATIRLSICVQTERVKKS